MKKRIALALAVFMALNVVFFAAGCAKKNPSVIKQTDAISLDVYDNATITLNVEDYIAQNSAKGITFSVTRTNPTNLSVTQPSEGKFTLTARMEGSSTVTLTAQKDGEALEEIKSVITVTITDSTPNLLDVHGLGNNGEVDIVGSSQAAEGNDYTFSVSVGVGYVAGDVKVTFKVGEGAAQTISPTSSSNSVFNFTIEGIKVNGEITILEVTGITEHEDAVAVSLPESDDFFLIAGSNRAFAGVDYVFHVTTKSFLLNPKAHFNGEIVKGVAVSGSETLFSITVLGTHITKPAGLVVDKVSNTGLVASDMAERFYDIGSWGKIPSQITTTELNDEGVEVPTSANLATQNSTFDYSLFGNKTEQTIGVPTQEGTGIIKFENNASILTNAWAANFAASTQSSNPKAERNIYYHYSFMLKAEDEFEMVMCGTSTLSYATGGQRSLSGWQEGNWIRLFSENGVIGVHNRQNALGEDGLKASGLTLANFEDKKDIKYEHRAAATAADTEYTVGAWNRFDLVFYREEGDFTTEDELDRNDTVIMRLFINGEKVEFEAGETLTPNSSNRVDREGSMILNWSEEQNKLWVENGNFHFKAGNDGNVSKNAANYGRNFAVVAKASPVWFASVGLESTLMPA